MPRPFNGGKNSLQQIALGKSDTQCERMKLDSHLIIPYTKINSKWIKYLNVRDKIIKFLEENIGEKLHEIGFGNDFLHMTPKAQK